MNSNLFLRLKQYARHLKHLPFFVTMSVAFSVRLKYIFIERMWPDEALYCWYAQRIHNIPSLMFSKEIVEFHPPLFAILLSLGHFLFSPEMACRIVSLIINMTGIIAIYVLGIKVSGLFLGIFCCITLAFNFLYLSQSTHILIDGPFVVAWIFLILLLNKINTSNSLKNGIYVGLMGAIIVLLKWPGIIVIPFLLIYYSFAFPELSLFARVKKTFIPLAIISSITLSIIIYFSFLTGHIWPDVSVLKGAYMKRPFWFYVFNFHEIVMIPYLIPFFIYGFFVTLKSQNRRERLLFVWFITFFLALSLSNEKTFRYSLLIIPSSLLIAGIGIESIFKKFLKTQEKILSGKTICILCILLSYWHMYPKMEKVLNINFLQFTGFKETGSWIKEQVTPRTKIMVTSRRIVRYYSGINFKEFKGKLLPLPPNKKEFEEFIRNTKSPFLLEIDRWERTQPKWIYPISERKINYLSRLGFNLSKVIKRPLPFADGSQKKMPVIMLFKRDSIK